MRIIEIKPSRHLKYIFVSLLFFLLTPMLMLYILISDGKIDSYSLFIVIWIGLSVFYALGFILHIIYYKNDRKKTLFIENETIRIRNGKKETTEYRRSEIEEIININSRYFGRSPWDEYEYFLFRFKDGGNFVLTCLLVDIETINEIFPEQNIIRKSYFAAFLDERKRFL